MRTAAPPWRIGLTLLLCAVGVGALFGAVSKGEPLWHLPLLLSVIVVTALLGRRHPAASEADDGQGVLPALACSSLPAQPGSGTLLSARERVAALRRWSDLTRSAIAALTMAIDAKGGDVHSHVHRVCEYAVALAERLRLSHEELEAIKIAALLHDIGKLGVPEHILGKPGKLTSEEFEIIKSHVAIGTMILEPVRFPWPVVPIVLSHHERWDGNGYPNGLSGEEIPVGGRIVALADVFDALTSTRPYRTAMPPEKAIELIRAGSGTQFDPRVVEAFIAILPDVEAPRSRADAAAAHAMTLHPEAADSGRRSAVLTGASRALEQIARAHRETMALCELTELIVARPDLGRMLERVAGIVAKLVPYATLAVFLADEGGRMLEPAHVAGVGGALFAGMRLAVGEGVSGWVVEQNEAADNALPMLDVARRCRPGDAFPLGAALSVPLRADGQVIGAFTLYHAERRAYQSHHVRRLTRVAEMIGPALESARQFARTRRLALEDSVTRLPNVRALMQFLHQQCAQSDRSGRSFAVLMLDLDEFKGVNDTLGHLEGDAVLEQVASRLRECVRPMDYVARYAGDEFVVVLPGADGAAAARVADRVRTALDRLPAGSLPMAVGASIGAGCWPRDGREPRELLAAADVQMFQDKAVRKRRLLGGSPE